TVVNSFASAITKLRTLPVVMLPLDLSSPGPLVIPVPVLPLWPFQANSVARPISMTERTARVATISVAPHRLVAYIGDSVTFVAMGTGLDGRPAHGAKFQWDSSDTTKLSIDEAGRATMLSPGVVIVTARAGTVTQTAPVLIRNNRRPIQTDQEWRDDQ